MRSIVSRFSPLFLVALAFAACSSDEDSPASPPASAAKTVTEIVVENARFGTLEAAVVAADVKAAQVVSLDKATTALGKDVRIEVRDGKVFLNGNTQVTITDIPASNGTIHVIDAVLLPPAG